LYVPIYIYAALNHPETRVPLFKILIKQDVNKLINMAGFFRVLFIWKFDLKLLLHNINGVCNEKYKTAVFTHMHIGRYIYYYMNKKKNNNSFIII
jgi:hypothetical protein